MDPRTISLVVSVIILTIFIYVVYSQPKENLENTQDLNQKLYTYMLNSQSSDDEYKKYIEFLISQNNTHQSLAKYRTFVELKTLKLINQLTQENINKMFSNFEHGY